MQAVLEFPDCLLFENVWLIEEAELLVQLYLTGDGDPELHWRMAKTARTAAVTPARMERAMVSVGVCIWLSFSAGGAGEDEGEEDGGLEEEFWEH